MTTWTTETENVVSVWSSYGHHFIGEDENYVSCLRCGAMYQLLADADDPSRGEYLTNSGETPQDCTGDTGMCHGYYGERHCHEHDDSCSHTDHDCNCILCDS